ncbi:MAG: LON peptidase substrate-binding domain-containing protein [Thiotrichales bacterium]
MSEMLPIFPLYTVLFPDGLLPLRIFEPRYLDMVCRCLREDSGFVVSLIHAGKEVGEAAEVYTIGTEARIIDWEKRDDGLLGVMALGTRRVHIDSTRIQADQLLVGEVTPLDDESPRPLPTEYEPLARILSNILGEIQLPYDQPESRMGDAVWVSRRLTEFLPVNPKHKQALLEIEDPLQRLRILRDDLVKLEIL